MRITSVDDVARVVRGARRDRGWTQAELASRAGVSRDWVNRVERGSGRAEVAKVLDVFAALGLAAAVDERASPVDLSAIVRNHATDSG